jgi:hypothetical protein
MICNGLRPPTRQAMAPDRSSAATAADERLSRHFHLVSWGCATCAIRPRSPGGDKRFFTKSPTWRSGAAAAPSAGTADC